MVKQKWFCLALTVVLGSLCCGETYHLNAETGWQNVADSSDGEYLLAISKIKQQLLTGDEEEVLEALDQLKADFPDMASEEIDAFIEAEQLYAASVWHKAAVKYKTFLKTWPESVLYSTAIERYYSIGVAYLQGEKRRFVKILKLPAFDDGVNIMWDIYDQEGSSQTALRALTTLAEAQEKKKEYFEAYQTWAEIVTRWPTGKTRQQALLRMAQGMHASYSGSQYDSAALETAQLYYEEFAETYPTLAEELKISDELALIQEQLAYKYYELGFYYERTDKPEAAKLYYGKVLAGWPDSKAAQMVQVRQSPQAPAVYQSTQARKLFKLSNAFLDSWFGIDKIFDKMLPEDDPESERSSDILGEGAEYDDQF